MAFVISEGQVARLDRPPSIPSGSVRLTDTVAQDYATIWRTQPAVRTVVSFLARNIAQLGLHAFERVSDTDRRRLHDHPMVALLSRPNSRTTRYRLIDSTINDLGIYDNAFWLKSRTEDRVNGLLRLPSQHMEPVGDSWLWAEKYRFRGAKGYRDFYPDEVVHFRGYNPTDSRWGLSPMETLRRILVEEYEAGKYREQLWRNGARFPGVIQRPAQAPAWSEPARNRFKADWRGLYTGDGPGAGGTPVLEDGMTYEASGITPREAQYLEARKLTREEVAAAFHIPLPMVGILDHATFSNIEEQHKQLYQDSLAPWLTMIEEEIGLQLLPDLDASSGVYVEFNLAEKMKGSFEEQARSMQTAVGAPWMTRNEARGRVNLPQIDGGDELITPLNVVEGGQASPTDSAPTGQAAYDATLAKFWDRQARAVGALVGAGKSAWWDGARWDRELAADLNGIVADPWGHAQDVNSETKTRLDVAVAQENPMAAVAAAFKARGG